MSPHTTPVGPASALGQRLPLRAGRGPRVAVLVAREAGGGFHGEDQAGTWDGSHDTAGRGGQHDPRALQEAAVLSDAGATVRIFAVSWLPVARGVLEWAPDVVHARGSATLAAALWVVHRCGARLVYEARDLGPGRGARAWSLPARRLQAVVEARGAARADAVLADSPTALRRVARYRRRGCVPAALTGSTPVPAGEDQAGGTALVAACRSALMGPARARVGEVPGAAARRRPRLLILSFSPIASDARVLKQVRLLSTTHEVTTCGYGQAPEGVVAHVRIPDELVSWRLDRASLVARRFAHAQDAQEVVAWARGQLQVGAWDVVLANDAETVPLALSLRPLGGVHADLHEYAPRQKEGVARWRLFVAPYVRWLCRRYVARADSVTTVAPGLARAYQREYGIRASVVTNATPYHDLPVTPVARPLRLVHSGAALPDRHLELMIEAVGRTSREVTLDLYLTRNDPALIERLRQQAAALPPGRVRVLDPVPYAELVGTLAGYDVGVFFLPPVSFNYTYTLPNKLFDFVQARLAVVVSPSPEMARLVREHRLGVVADSFSVSSLTAALDSLTDQEVARAKQASSQAARVLSAERQVAGWAHAVAALDRRARALDPSIAPGPREPGRAGKGDGEAPSPAAPPAWRVTPDPPPAWLRAPSQPSGAGTTTRSSDDTQ